MWNQVYNPLDNATLSTIAAAIPVVTASDFDCVQSGEGAHRRRHRPDCRQSRGDPHFHHASKHVDRALPSWAP